MADTEDLRFVEVTGGMWEDFISSFPITPIPLPFGEIIPDGYNTCLLEVDVWDDIEDTLKNGL